MHAFRKLGTEQLPREDCHSLARAALIKEIDPGSFALLAVSIAWDWQFRGVTAEGIHRETTAMLESQYLVDSRRLMSLATTRTALLAMAKNLYPNIPEEMNTEDTLFPLLSSEGGCDNSEEIIARGIAPVVKHIVQHELDVAGEAKKFKSTSFPAIGRCKVNSASDQQLDPEVNVIDPDGNEYVCRYCGVELGNLYFHCFGCEQILGRDFNFCGTCFFDEKTRSRKVCMVEGKRAGASNASHVNHIGERPAGSPKCHLCITGSEEAKCNLCKKCLGTYVCDFFFGLCRDFNRLIGQPYFVPQSAAAFVIHALPCISGIITKRDLLRC